MFSDRVVATHDGDYPSSPGRWSPRRAHRHDDSSVADVVDLILDKGLVIDVFVRVSLLGLEILTIDIFIVIASVDTFLQFAEAANRLDLYGRDVDEAVAKTA